MKVTISFDANVSSEHVEELKRIVDHHIDWLLNLNEFTEIKGIWNAKLIPEDEV